MSDGRWGVQAAIFTVLSDAGIAGGRIFAPVAENYEPPNGGDIYVSIEDGGDVQDDYECMSGLDERVLLHVWHRATSYKTVKETISAIRDELHDVPLTVTGRTAYSQVRSTRIEKDSDGLHLHGIVEVIVLHHA